MSAKPRFSIEVQFDRSVTPKQRVAFEAAKQRWSRIILARGSGASGSGADSLRILVKCAPLDRQGGLSANTEIDPSSLLRPTAGRAEHLPTRATIILDKSDMQAVQEEAEPARRAQGRPGRAATLNTPSFLVDLIAHEIGHALGLSSEIWERKGLLKRNLDTNTPVFTGSAAKKSFGEALHKPPTNVPLEVFGDRQEFLSHWRQAYFHSELMTFILEDNPNRIGPITVGALKDLGYEVDAKKAETQEVDLTGSPAPPTGPAEAQRRHMVLRERRWINCQVTCGIPGKKKTRVPTRASRAPSH